VFGAAARITPYRVQAIGGKPFELTVTAPGGAEIELVVPAGWECEQTAEFGFVVVPRIDQPVRRARVAAAITADGRYLGQLAEALIDVRLP